MAQSTPPLAEFTFSPTLASFNVPMKTYLASPALKDKTREAISSGALIFSPTSKILILQRSPSDSSPNKWETPGGGVDEDDTTIMHGVAREVFEESGLTVTHIKRLVPLGDGGEEGFAFQNSRGLRVLKFTFEVEVESVDQVTLDAKEHQMFMWANEEEIRSGRMEDGFEFELTGWAQRDVIIEAFRLRRKEDEGA
ncbi:hypothetical protein VTL71DRAFT_4450 [Oculimacula yallundae]|uniref:Nudix hydrolase domain-containing protein n=1 Tax=Oculimacula yallundae TaxID=86028 RepID=A0ABR4C201_9HELO